MASSPVPAMVAIARRRLLAHFRTGGATREADAIRYEGGRLIERRQFDRMLKSGVFREAGNGRYWLDEKRAEDWTAARRKRGLIIAGLAAAAAAIFLS